MALLFYFYCKRQRGAKKERHPNQIIEIKLRGVLTPSEIHVKTGLDTKLIIHRYDEYPSEELFEIEELEIYEILPSLHTTTITFIPRKAGRFPIILGGEQNAGVIDVE